jgi:DNA adenine methylase
MLNNLMDRYYAEPYAGGCSIALSLLLSQYALKIFINDKDEHVHAFWHSVLYETEYLLKLVHDAKLDMGEWT